LENPFKYGGIVKGPSLRGEQFEMVLELLPTAYRFSEGRRIRVTLAFADADNFYTPVVRLLRDKNHASFIELPLLGLK